MNKSPVLMDQDGGIDDFLSTLLLARMPHVDLLGVVVTPGDCYIEPAVSATRKVLALADASEVAVARSHARPINPFPRIWRRITFAVDNLPLLNENAVPAPLDARDGASFIVDTLQSAETDVTILVTGPLTTLADAVRRAPSIIDNIANLVWMGGALEVPGNVHPLMEPGQDGSMEWNSYWDPEAVATIWDTSIPVTLCPLDLTNHVPVTTEIVKQLASGQRKSDIAAFAGQCYAMVISDGDYFFWDVLTTSYLAVPELFNVTTRDTRVVPAGVSQGRIMVDDKQGRPTQILTSVDLAGFYDYLLSAWEAK